MISLESAIDRAPIPALVPGGLEASERVRITAPKPSGARDSAPGTIRDLLRQLPALPDSLPLAEVPLAAGCWFGLRSLPVVDERGLPAGVLRRSELVAWVSQDDGWVTLEKPRLVRELARPPRAIWWADVQWSLMLGRMREQRPSAGDECLVIHEDGRYAGIVTAVDLLRRAASASG